MSAWETVPVDDPVWPMWDDYEREEWLRETFDEIGERTWRGGPLPVSLWVLPGVAGCPRCGLEMGMHRATLAGAACDLDAALADLWATVDAVLPRWLVRLIRRGVS